MTTIDAINGPLPTVPSGPDKPEQKSVIGSDFETFLKMLTTQLKNQDPLNPIESSDFAVQLATFSSVEQQVMTNDLLSGLSSQMGQMGMAQLASWVGMQGRAAMPVQFDGFPVTLHVAPTSTADTAELVVRDARGGVVQTLTFPASNDTYEWTGRDAAGQPLPPGLYSFEVESISQGQLQGSSVPEIYGRIQEATLQAGRTVLVMDGGARIDADQVTALRE